MLEAIKLSKMYEKVIVNGIDMAEDIARVLVDIDVRTCYMKQQIEK